MSKILMLKGLPASGKSTYAKELVHRGGWKRVNKDDLRAMLDSSKWSKGNEKFVLEIRDIIVLQALNSGQSVVVDDTNFNPVHEQSLKTIADQFKVPFEVKFFDTPPEECIKRDLLRPQSVGSGVIWEMYNKYLKPAPETYTPPVGKPKTILCDIDGTLAHGIGVTRKPYEWLKVDTDTLDSKVAKQLDLWADRYNIVLMSGRDSVCRDLTEKWLEKHNVDYNQLFMRAAGDNRKDAIVKRELFEQHIRDNYAVELVLDDRDQVVDMWRSMGLTVWQVADGKF